MSVSNEELVTAILQPLHDCLQEHGITLDFLVQKLKRELNAKQSHYIKVRGAVKSSSRGRRVIATTGVISYDSEGNPVAGDGDSVIEWDEINWGIRQKARMDAHKLRGDYPAERHEIRGGLTLLAPESVKKPENSGIGENG